jgi:hypothetical protein
VRDVELVQLPVEPRDLVVPLLEGHLCPLKFDPLLLEPALGLFPRQMLTLEGSPDLGKCSPLLLEQSLRLLVCDPFLPELLLRRGERGGLVRQAGPQLLCLPGLLFGLALPSKRSLEGRGSCWSWARTDATSASHSATSIRAPARSFRALRSTSS